jgi:flagellar protein FliS
MNASLIAYRQSSIETATPGQLVVMLYEGLLTALDKAGTALQRPGDVEEAHSEFTRAQAIVMELASTLNMSAGPVAHNLAAIYEYCHSQLVKANISKSIEPAEPVRTIFADLRDAWVQIAGASAS